VRRPQGVRQKAVSLLAWWAALPQALQAVPQASWDESVWALLTLELQASLQGPWLVAQALELLARRKKEPQPGPWLPAPQALRRAQLASRPKVALQQSAG
jgi:hypothetical protein